MLKQDLKESNCTTKALSLHRQIKLRFLVKEALRFLLSQI